MNDGIARHPDPIQREMQPSASREHTFDRLLRCVYSGPSPIASDLTSQSNSSRPNVRRFSARIPPEFSAGGIPFGGFLLALAVAALEYDLEEFPPVDKPGKEKKEREVAGLQVVFLEGGKEGACWVDLSRVREGGSVVAQGVLGQQTSDCQHIELLRFYGTYDVLPELASFDDEDHITDAVPAHPPFDSMNFTELKEKTEPWMSFGNLLDRVALPFPPLAGPFQNLPEVRYALRIPGRPVDARSLAFFTDAFSTPLRRIPEIQARSFRGLTLDAHLRVRRRMHRRGNAAPAAGGSDEWVLVRAHSGHLTSGWYDCVCEVWNAEGKLLVTGGQTRMMRGRTRDGSKGGRKVKVGAKI
ncbi:hypothetical protein M427DRAFT_29112 [Gonapodya prolifera JEL478]|uniref:Thioesterase/thiol ester dehydrase-isomerase n=1 Tax=Gonapodya prolifera (strain JEL478) TaxID=1344416 RepID=A0A139AR48_GONPJ|nr:hypothetical protein M427DRAFT_29112 [Gonapodya prolifera JEL478]|eukprot:KXS19124.1 hypothetical protein M427DRAFT_29112 [Gonapodya prolifera JEL478]